MEQKRSDHSPKPHQAAYGLALGVGLVLIVLTIGFRYAIHEHECRTVERFSEQAAASVKTQILMNIQPRIAELRHMAVKTATSGTITRKQWESEIRLYEAEFPCLEMMAWIDPALRMQWVYPATSSDVREGMELPVRSCLRRGLIQARQSHDLAYIGRIRLPQAGEGFSALVPIEPTEPGNPFLGYFGGFFNYRLLFNQILPANIAPDYALVILDGKKEVFRHPEKFDPGAARFIKEAPVRFAGLNWTIRVAPTEQALSRQQTCLDEVVLLTGCTIAILFSLLIIYIDSIRKTRSKAEAAERRYRSLVQATCQIVWVTDNSARFFADLPHWRIITGQSTEELLGHGWLSAIHPEDRGRMMEIWTRAVQNKCIYESEQRIRTRTGEYRWFVCRGVPIVERDGSVHEWIGTSDDIHDRRMAEAALRESEERFHATFNQAAAGIAHFDPQGRVLLANRRLCELLGTNAEEICRLNFGDFAHPEDRPTDEEPIRRLLAGEIKSFTLEKRLIPKNGAEIWVNLSLALVRDNAGAPLYLVGVIEDISARRRVQGALRASEERYRVLTETIPQMVWTNRPDGTFDFCNQHWCEYTGLSLADSIKTGWTAALSPQDMHRALTAWHLALRSGRPLTAELRLHRVADKSFRWHFVHIVPARDDAGHILNWIGAAVDIDDRKKAEESLLEADRCKDEFLAMLAHELRNPLAPIRYAVHLLRQSGIEDPVLQKQRDLIDRQVSYMGRLLDDLLDVSRITQGKITLRKEIVDLRDVAEQAIEASRGLTNERGHELFYLCGDEPIWVEGDFIRLEQILYNLLNNAIKYTETGGSIWVTIGTESTPDAPEPLASIHVRDNGIGIAPEMLPHVFDLFTQADRSLDRSRGGLGIGLTLVRSLIGMHDGRVEAGSEGLGRGSEFIIRLPLAKTSGLGIKHLTPAAPPELAPAERNAPERLGETEALKILVVDDNIDTAHALAELLEMWGHQAAVAFDGLLTLKLARELQPDVVLLDIGLPDVDGYEVARRLREEVGLVSALLIALTGYGRDEDRNLATQAGFNYHFTKPIATEELQTILQKLTERLARS